MRLSRLSLARAIILFAPAGLVLTPGFWTRALLLAVASSALLLSAGWLPPVAAKRWVHMVRPFAVAGAVFAGFILLQSVPLGISGLARSIWVSSGTALGTPATASASIDRGATLIWLEDVMGFIGLAAATVAISLDRTQAERVLIGLACAGTLAWVLAWACTEYSPAFQPLASDVLDASPILAMVTLLVWAAAGYRALERFETRAIVGTASRGTAFARLAVSAFGTVIAALFLITYHGFRIAPSAVVGLLTLALLLGIRRIPLPFVGKQTLAVATVLIALVVVERAHNPAFAIVAPIPELSAEAINAVRRAIEDAGAIGAGAGTASAVLPIYGVEAKTALPVSVSAVLQFGPLAAAIAGLAAVLAALWLGQGALTRGRDSFYAALGASTLVAFISLLSTSPGLFSAPVVAFIVPVLALALTQARSFGRE